MEAPSIQFNAADPLQWKEKMLSEGRTEEAKLASAAGEFEALLLEGRLPETAQRVLLEVAEPGSPSRNREAGAG